jgi:hypothetical protein
MVRDTGSDPFISRSAAAALITDVSHPVKERTLAEWPEVPIVMVSGRGCARRSEWLAAAKRRLEDQLAKQGVDVGRRKAATAARAAYRRTQQAAEATETLNT